MKKVEQIAIFLENKTGRLAEITRTLAEENINIQAMSLADTADFGILRLIVNDTEKAQAILKKAGFTVGKNEVLVLAVQDRPGGLAAVLAIIDKANINIEYMYAYTKKRNETGLIIFRFENIEQARSVLEKKGIRILSGDEVYTA